MRRPEVGIFAVAMLVSACTVPTEMPNWDVQWNLPVNVDDLGVDITDVRLPTGITIDSTNPTPTTPAVRTGLSVQVSSVPPISRGLMDQCLSCPTGTAPKPSFNAPPASTTVNLTAGSSLQSATLVSGSQLVLVLNNGFQFDPINPPGGLPGTVTLAVSSGTATLGTQTLTGGSATLPPNALRTVTIPLSGTITASSPITVVMTMDSPAGSAGSPVSMSPAHTFTVNSTATLKVGSAMVAIASAPLDPSMSEFDLSGLSDMALRVENTTAERGVMLLTVNNPLSIGANTTLAFTGTKEIDDGEFTTTRPMTTITKNIVLPAGGGTSSTTTVTVPFTGTELREMLGSNMVATFQGNTVGGTTVVTPTSRISITARMRIRLFVKEIEQ